MFPRTVTAAQAGRRRLIDQLNIAQRKGREDDSRTYLRHQSLEEAAHTLISQHATDDPEAAFWILKVTVLDSGFDDVERGGYDQGSAGTCDGCDKVLHPARCVVVCQLVEIFFGEGGAAEELFQMMSVSFLLVSMQRGRRVW